MRFLLVLVVALIGCTSESATVVVSEGDGGYVFTSGGSDVLESSGPVASGEGGDTSKPDTHSAGTANTASGAGGTMSDSKAVQSGGNSVVQTLGTSVGGASFMSVATSGGRTFQSVHAGGGSGGYGSTQATVATGGKPNQGTTSSPSGGTTMVVTSSGAGASSIECSSQASCPLGEYCGGAGVGRCGNCSKMVTNYVPGSCGGGIVPQCIYLTCPSGSGMTVLYQCSPSPVERRSGNCVPAVGYGETSQFWCCT